MGGKISEAQIRQYNRNKTLHVDIPATKRFVLGMVGYSPYMTKNKTTFYFC